MSHAILPTFLGTRVFARASLNTGLGFLLVISASSYRAASLLKRQAQALAESQAGLVRSRFEEALYVWVSTWAPQTRTFR